MPTFVNEGTTSSNENCKIAQDNPYTAPYVMGGEEELCSYPINITKKFYLLAN